MQEALDFYRLLNDEAWRKLLNNVRENLEFKARPPLACLHTV